MSQNDAQGGVLSNGVGRGAARGAPKKRWPFTINFAGPNGVVERDGEFLELKNRLEGLVGSGDVGYWIVGCEVGASGTPHLQGYVELVKKRRINWLKNQISGRAHWEVARGTPEQNRTYCSKEEPWAEGGQISTQANEQGRRTDIEEAKADLLGGMSMYDFAEKHFSVMVKHPNGVNAVRRARPVGRPAGTEVHVYWYWGDAGTGKTHAVHQECGAFEDPGALWIAMDNSMQWFDGYDGHKAVLFDDFDHIETTRLDVFKKVLDKYHYRVPIKGGSVMWVPEKIYFTSNRDFEDVVNEMREEHREAIRRRVHTVKHFTDLMQHRQ